MSSVPRCPICQEAIDQQWKHCPRCGSPLLREPITAELSLPMQQVQKEAKVDTRLAGLILVMLGVLVLVAGAASIPQLMRQAHAIDGLFTAIAIVSGLAVAVISVGFSMAVGGRANPASAVAAGILGGLATAGVVLLIMVLAFVSLAIGLIAACFSALGPGA